MRRDLHVSQKQQQANEEPMESMVRAPTKGEMASISLKRWATNAKAVTAPKLGMKILMNRRVGAGKGIFFHLG